MHRSIDETSDSPTAAAPGLETEVRKTEAATNDEPFFVRKLSAPLAVRTRLRAARMSFQASLARHRARERWREA